MLDSVPDHPCWTSVPDSVPLLKSIEGFSQYTGNVMVPFSNDFFIVKTIYPCL